MWQLTTVCNFRSKRPNALYCTWQSQSLQMVRRQTHGQNTHAHKVKNKYFLR
ncbi:mCG148334, partial [Mus musculus]